MRLSRRLKRELKILGYLAPLLIFTTFAIFYFAKCIIGYVELVEKQNTELRDAIIYYLKEEPKH